MGGRGAGGAALPPAPGAFLERSAGASYGCVVTDVRMPEMDGLEMLEELRRQGIAAVARGHEEGVVRREQHGS